MDVDWLVVTVAFLVIAAFTGTWHQVFWDVYVAPIHNIEEWNLRKVLIVHTPNLILSLSLLTLFGSGVLVVVAQVIALVGSSVKMHFPAPTDQDTAMDGTALDMAGS